MFLRQITVEICESPSILQYLYQLWRCRIRMNLGFGCYLAGNSCSSVKIMPKGKESRPQPPEDDHHIEDISTGVHIFEVHVDTYSMGVGITSLCIILAILLMLLWVWKKGKCGSLCKKRRNHSPLPMHLSQLQHPMNPYPASAASFPWQTAPSAPRITEVVQAEQQPAVALQPQLQLQLQQQHLQQQAPTHLQQQAPMQTQAQAPLPAAKRAIVAQPTAQLHT